MTRLVVFALLVSASAMAPWNSSDMIRTKQQDIERQSAIQKQLAERQRESSDADAVLKKHETILKISQQELSKAQKSRTGTIGGEATAKKTLATMLDAQKRAHEKLVKVTETTKEAYERRAEAARTSQLAQNASVAARTEVSKRSDALDAANVHLQQVVLTHPEEAPAAQANVDTKDRELKEAEGALSKAEKSEAEADAGLLKAQGHLQESVAAEKEAKEAAGEADAHVTAQKATLNEIQTKDQPKKEVVARLTNAVTNQTRIVKSLTAASKAKGAALNATIKERDAVTTEIGHDTTCIKDLQAKESARSKQIAAWNKIKSAYLSTVGSVQEHLKGVLWTTKDSLAEATFELYKVQSECARDIKVPPVAPHTKPLIDTGGTCAFLGCDTSRHAQCLVVDGHHKCMCAEGTIVKNGVCVDRGNPLQASAVPAAPASNLDGLTLAATAGALAACGAAALALTRRRAQQVKMPKSLLG